MTELKQVVYITTGGVNQYLKMALISAASLSLIHPDLKVIFLTEDATSIRSTIETAFANRIDLIEIATPDNLNPTEQSRFIKTSITEHVEGAFCYIDSDTLIANSFADFFSTINRPVAGVLNRHRGSPVKVRTRWAEPICKSMNWQWPPSIFINGGMLYFDGSEESKSFCNRWHKLWLQQLSETSEGRDQASLNQVVHEMQDAVALLPLAYNAFVGAAPCYALQGKIWHFFVHEGYPRKETILADLLNDYEKEGRIDLGLIEKEIVQNLAHFNAQRFWGTEDPLPPAYYYKSAKQAAVRNDQEAMNILSKEYVRLRLWSPFAWFLPIILFVLNKFFRDHSYD